MPKNTEQAIATLQAFVNTQQPLLDCVKYAVETLQAKYDVTIKGGDYLKITADLADKENTIVALNEIVSEKEAIITAHEVTITDLQKQLEDAKKPVADDKPLPVEETIITP